MKRHLLSLGISIYVMLALWVFDTHAYFENVQPSTRALGMGEAFVGIADDVSAIYYNPAGLGMLERAQVPTLYQKVFGGLDLGGMYRTYFAFASPYQSYGTFGGAWHRFAASFVANEDAEGVTKKYDLLAENLFFLSYGINKDLDFIIPKLNYRVHMEKLYLGFNLKIPYYHWGRELARRSSPENTLLQDKLGAPGLGLDFASLYLPQEFPDLSLGLVLTDLIKNDIGLYSQDKVESKIKFGLSYFLRELKIPELKYKKLHIPAFSIRELLISQDIILSTRKMEYHYFHLGTEKWLHVNNRDIALRTGFKLGMRSYQFYSLGASYRYFLPRVVGQMPFKVGFQTDYAFVMPLGGIKSTYGDHSFMFTLLQGEELDRIAPLSTVAVFPKTITPDRDGTNDFTRFSLQGEDESGIANWNVDIFKIDETNKSGVKREVVKTYSGSGEPPEQIQWEGQDESNNVVPNGAYFIEMRLRDKPGNKGKSTLNTISVFVEPIIFGIESEVTAFSPDSDNVDDEFTIYIDVDKRLEIGFWELRVDPYPKVEFGKIIFKPVRTFQGKEKPPNVLIWNGLNNTGNPVEQRLYRYRLKASTLDGAIYETPYLHIRVERKEQPADSLLIEPGEQDMEFEDEEEE